MTQFSVQFIKRSVILERYSIRVDAPDFAAAIEKVEQWGIGEGDLSLEENETESHERDLETVTTEFSGTIPVEDQGCCLPIEEESQST